MTAGKIQPTYWSPDSKGRDSRPTGAGAAQSSDRQSQFKRRDSVSHAQFGVGTVIESKLTRDDEEVTIAFPGVGVKRLLVSLAGLKKVS